MAAQRCGAGPSAACCLPGLCHTRPTWTARSTVWACGELGQPGAHPWCIWRDTRSGHRRRCAASWWRRRKGEQCGHAEWRGGRLTPLDHEHLLGERAQSSTCRFLCVHGRIWCLVVHGCVWSRWTSSNGARGRERTVFMGVHWQKRLWHRIVHVRAALWRGHGIAAVLALLQAVRCAADCATAAFACSHDCVGRCS